jgi:hypothetical protein
LIRRAIAVDADGNSYVTGSARVDSQGAFTDRKTFGGNDFATGVAVDLDDDPRFTGQTCSIDFPASIGLDCRKGKCAIFVLKLMHQSGPVTAKFIAVFGGGDSDTGAVIAVNANREAYVTGTTNSPIFHTNEGAYKVYPRWLFRSGVHHSIRRL